MFQSYANLLLLTVSMSRFIHYTKDIQSYTLVWSYIISLCYAAFMMNDILAGSCMCHVFYSSSAGQVAEVLTSISDGFSRTHFAV